MLKTVPEIIDAIKPTMRIITAEQAANEMLKNNGLLVDVREPAESVQMSAVNALNIPRGVLEMKMLEIEKNDARAIYLHCASGMRAILAGEQLMRLGYSNVSVINCPMTIISQTNFSA